jgi:hypothetical protein
MLNRPKFFAVRVVLRDDHGQTYSRDYVRGDKHLGEAAFKSWAVGDFIGIITDGEYRGIRLVSVEEVDGEIVRQNRQYHHTTH